MSAGSDRRGGPASPTHVRHPLTDALGFAWAVVPAVSLGLLTWLVLGFAAYRTKSRVTAVVAGGHLAVLVFLVSTAGVRDFPQDDWRNQLALWVWVLGVCAGGTVHAFVIRKRVFPPRALPGEEGPAGATAGEGRQVVAGPKGIAVPLSYLWALVPLLTLGFATFLVVGSAAVRLRSRVQAAAAAGYLVLFAALIIVDAPVGTLPNTDWRAQLYYWSWALSSWWGGTFHAFVLRQAVFTRRPAPVRGPVPTLAAGPPPPPAPPPAAPFIGPYRLVRRLGGGGQGVVHLGLTPTGERVAIKVLHASVETAAEHESFLREVAAARRVPPFATAPVIDVGVAGDAAYIVSEYVPGPSLETYVRRGRPMDGDGLIRLAIATAAALRGIHAMGIVHRDFKPANILLGPDGPRVIDFGVARALDRLTLTAGGAKGTPPYMSPEQVSGQRAGPPSDVFSWASTMYFAATGRLAFDGPSVYVISHRILGHHPDVSVLPEPLRHPAAACFSKDPGARPTAAQLMLAITR
ncbi:serine/threonine-protein kinase [Microbispora sp. NPDC088329]|uniref:serine/threonine-protein kinase n=1 Tax=Microbispora sp. NPDC088329 TaxID=3154869 RepID=UPI003438E659